MKQQCDTSRLAGSNDTNTTALPARECSQGKRANKQRFSIPDDEELNPRYALTRGDGFWELTFDGRRAVFKHGIGAFYVAHLLLNPPPEPVHGMALAMLATIESGKKDAVSCIVNPETGESVTVDVNAQVQERHAGLDDARTEWALLKRQRQLEILVDSNETLDPVKEEAQRELEEIYNFQKKNPWATRTTAQKTSDAVARAIKRFHQAMEKSSNPVLQAFAAHIKQHLLNPSGRGYADGGNRSTDTECVGGFFTYHPPEGVIWAGQGAA